jgi:hypothetical protein
MCGRPSTLKHGCPCCPADRQQPVRVIDLHTGDEVANLQREVGGVFDIVGHRECDLVINDFGRINGSPVNVRVTHWVLNSSELAKAGRAYEYSVIFGESLTGEMAYLHQPGGPCGPCTPLGTFRTRRALRREHVDLDLIVADDINDKIRNSKRGQEEIAQTLASRCSMRG